MMSRQDAALGFLCLDRIAELEGRPHTQRPHWIDAALNFGVDPDEVARILTASRNDCYGWLNALSPVAAGEAC